MKIKRQKIAITIMTLLFALLGIFILYFMHNQLPENAILDFIIGVVGIVFICFMTISWCQAMNYLDDKRDRYNG